MSVEIGTAVGILKLALRSAGAALMLPETVRQIRDLAVSKGAATNRRFLAMRLRVFKTC
jgi:hypothetical protein